MILFQDQVTQGLTKGGNKIIYSNNNMAKKRLLMFGGLAVVVLGMAGYLFWERYRGYEEYNNYIKLEQRYIQAMTEDTYGGKTPQETLDLFVAALEAEDVELASKYFMLDDNLSREGWAKELQAIKDRNVMAVMAKDIEGAEEDQKNRIDENDFKFVIYNKNGNVGGWVDMQFNRYSKVWKIESL